MVRALLEGKKTQTRRVIRKQPPDGHFIEACPWVDSGFALWRGTSFPKDHQGCTCERVGNPYGDTGDLLWVREAWCHVADHTYYRADFSDQQLQEEKRLRRLVPDISAAYPDARWKPSIHMPRWASRVTLKLKLVEPQRLHGITEDDAIAEGCERWHCGHPDCMAEGGHYGPLGAFHQLWNSINAKRGFGWDQNPWVWAITFNVIKENVDQLQSGN